MTRKRKRMIENVWISRTTLQELLIEKAKPRHRRSYLVSVYTKPRKGCVELYRTVMEVEDVS